MVVLLGQYLGGRHHRDLEAVLHALQGGERGDHRLAAAHVALQQALHRMGEREVTLQLAPGAPLRARQAKRQRGDERPGERAARNERMGAPRCGGAGGRRAWRAAVRAARRT